MSWLTRVLGVDTSNPMEFAKGQAQYYQGQAENYQNQANQFLDANNPFYQNAQKNFFGNLNQTLNSSSPTQNSLLALAMSNGSNYGGSQYIANKQREQITQKNTDFAGQSANQFGGQLYQQGLGAFTGLSKDAVDMQGLGANMWNAYGEGRAAAQQSNNSFVNSMIGLVGGLGSSALTGGLSNILGSGFKNTATGAGVSTGYGRKG